jgi:selenide, water dikinase
LSQLPADVHQDLLVGTETRDDAAVYRVAPDLALVMTADFITPIVDDPVEYGAIAAANALSDVYAMGGRPLTALNLAGFPRASLELSVLTEILSAAAATVHEAGAITVGGHTIDDPELKFGLSVLGRVHPDNVVRNTGARPGDVLYLTKPLGVGIISTGAKQDRLPPGVLDEAVAQMRRLNREAADAMVEVGVSAATDVTGFGLLGHLGQMAAASRVSARLQSELVPMLEGALELAEAGVVPSGTRRNLAAAEAVTGFADSISSAQRLLLADAQTSGGLVIAVAPGRAEQLEAAMLSRRLRPPRIGMVEAGEPGRVEVA